MKKLRFTKLILILTICSAYIFAQDSSGTLMSNQGRALEFKLSNLISISSFQGSTISYKKYYSGGRAYRLGLTVDLGGNNIKADNKYIYDYSDIDSVYSELYDDEDETIDISFNLYLQRLHYFNPNNQFQTFFGYGPAIGYSYLEDRNKLWSVVPSQNNAKDFIKTNEYLIGATLSLGVEWFCLKNISLLAEYNSYLYFIYSNENYSYKRMYYTNINNEKVWYQRINKYSQIEKYFRNNDYVKLGVAIQF